MKDWSVVHTTVRLALHSFTFSIQTVKKGRSQLENGEEPVFEMGRSHLEAEVTAPISSLRRTRASSRNVES